MAKAEVTLPDGNVVVVEAPEKRLSKLADPQTMGPVTVTHARSGKEILFNPRHVVMVRQLEEEEVE